MFITLNFVKQQNLLALLKYVVWKNDWNWNDFMFLIIKFEKKRKLFSFYFLKDWFL